jgi:hypothetical protein
VDALLYELCVEYGWCMSLEGSRAVQATDPRDRSAIADAIIRGEFGESGLQDADTRAFLMPIVDDWLFDPSGRGARSGLPL